MTNARRTRTISLAALAAVLLLAVLAGGSLLSSTPSARVSELARNPELDPGTRLSAPAPNFTLRDEFGRPVSLHSYRGKVVILAFNDSQCTTICPLTTTAMVDAKAMLGAAGSRVQLLGIDANPTATSVADVRAYSQLHGMLHQWRFLTGSLAQLKRVWHAYNIDVAIQAGQIDHTPALFVIDPQGRLRRLYLTLQSYAAVGQLGQLLASEASTLIAGHPKVHSDLSYAQVQGIAPTTRTALPRADGGTVALGVPGQARLYLFFATWDREVMSLGSQLEALGRYQSLSAAKRLPPLVAVDEGSVEPSASVLPSFLRGLRRPLPYPVAIDPTGRVGDGYQVQDEPWLVLTSTTGRILWYRDVSTAGWPGTAALIRDVSSALAHTPTVATGSALAQQELAGSPAPLAALHQQANQLLGSEPALAARLRALRGYPVVINAWASWCGPCRAEFSLFASASAQYGRRVAFLGADTGDSAGDAQAFLSQHRVSYPSYQATTTNISGIVPQGIVGLPTTIFIDKNGKVVFVHSGQYESQGALDGDIGTYALG